MNKQAKIFVLGMEQSRKAKGMKWYGEIPEEIKELYDIPFDFKNGYISGVYITVEPRYEPFTPEFLEKLEKEGRWLA